MARHEAELSTMMCFMSDEVIEKVHEVGRKVLPRGGRDRAAAGCAETDQFDHAFTAALKGAG